MYFKLFVCVLFFFVESFLVSAQIPVNKVIFKDTARQFLAKEIERLNEDLVIRKIREKYNPENTVFLSDTSKIDIIIPIFVLRNLNKCNYSLLTPLIDLKSNYYMQFAFIDLDYSYNGLAILKGIKDEIWQYNIKKRDDYRIGLSNDCTFSWRPKFDEKHFNYYSFKKYVYQNPSVQVFTIFRITGLWGFKNGRLIRLSFSKKKQVIELDGEKYYHEVLQKDSPNGIQRVIDWGFYDEIEFRDTSVFGDMQK